MKATVKTLNQIVNDNLEDVEHIVIINNGIRVVYFKSGSCISNEMPFGQEITIKYEKTSFYDYQGSDSKDKKRFYMKEWLQDIEEDKVEMTVKQIEERLGHGVKIIGTPVAFDK